MSAYGTKPLLGPSYQPLRRAFWDVPVRPPARSSLARVLVVFGGTDASGLRDSTVAALAAAYPEVVFDVVDTPRTAEEMRDAMLAADAAVTAAGQTLHELARTGTPSVAVCVADNQLAQARAWEEAGAIVLAGSTGDFRITETIVASLGDLVDPATRARMSHAGPALVDGQGALRVARALLGRMLDQRTRFVPATGQDEDAMLALANDPVVRASSLSTEPISPDSHRGWFAHRLTHPETSMMLLAWDGPVLAGQVRLDMSSSEALVSISIAEGYRGLGWGPLLLENAVRRLARERPTVTTLVANVRPENAASIAMFEKAGFTRSAGSPADPVAAEAGAIEFRREASAK